MRIVQLTESEASNPDVMRLVAEYLLTDGDAHVKVPPPSVSTALKSAGVVSTTGGVFEMKVPPIGIDAPDVGKPYVPPVSTATPQPSPGVFIDASTIGFGSTLPPAPLSAVAAVSATALGSSTTVPAPPVPAALPDQSVFVPDVPVPNFPPEGTSSPAGVVLDKAGLYWDERIHSSSRQQNADGTWRKKRGAPEDLITMVEGQIRQILAIPAPAGAPVAPPLPAAAQAPTPAIPAPPATPVVDGSMEFTRWLEELSPHMQPGGAFTLDMMGKLAVQVGCDAELGLSAFMARPDLIPPAKAILNGWLANPASVPQ